MNSDPFKETAQKSSRRIASSKPQQVDLSSNSQWAGQQLKRALAPQISPSTSASPQPAKPAPTVPTTPIVPVKSVPPSPPVSSAPPVLFQSDSSEYETEDDDMSTKELRIAVPKPFTGEREDLNTFIQDSHVYLKINADSYDDDTKRVAFMLALMNGGTAKAWKEAYVADILNAKKGTFPKHDDFVKDLKKAFLPGDPEGDARAKIRQLKQGKSSVDEYNAQFRILAGQSGITEFRALKDYYMQGLNTGILAKIFSNVTQPKTMEEWYNTASTLDSNHQRLLEIKGRTTFTSPKSYLPRHTNATVRDPNAMDVDQITVEERNRLFQERKCFNCKKFGHRAKDCRSPKGNQTTPNEIVRHPGIRKTVTTRTAIRSLVADLNVEERAELWNDMQIDSDF
jgi:hypothetical protein